jgi:hypothetical protein
MAVKGKHVCLNCVGGIEVKKETLKIHGREVGNIQPRPHVQLSFFELKRRLGWICLRKMTSYNLWCGNRHIMHSRCPGSKGRLSTATTLLGELKLLCSQAGIVLWGL